MQDFDNLIKQIFFEEVVPECSAGKLNIGDWYPAVLFNTKIVEMNKIYGDIAEMNPKPLLVIKDVCKFIAALIEYTKKAIEFYYNNDYSHDNLKKIISLVFANASEHDLVNPTDFLRLRLNFLKWQPKGNFHVNFMGYDSKIIIKKNNPILESPILLF